MAWTNITKPAVGDPTKKQAFADTVVDDLTFLYNSFLSLVGSREVIINGSFESDADADGFPDGWTRTLFTGGSFSHETSTVAADGKAIHGKRAIKFTSPGGVGNGGGYVDSTDFFEITETRDYMLTFQHKSSVAGILNIVTVTFYDCTQTSISTTTLYTSAANPTVWTQLTASFKPPANARYAKLRFTGADSSNTTAGSAWFDNIQIKSLMFENSFTITTAGAVYWTVPPGVTAVEIQAYGGGAGGGGSNGGGLGGGGGGAGGLVYGIVPVTPGTTYIWSVGAAGTGGSAAPTDGVNGGDTVVTIGATVFTASGGVKGKASNAAGTGGAGGAATGGTINSAGGAGTNRAATAGGDGGTPYHGFYADGAASVNRAGPLWGAGSSGGGDNGGAGSAALNAGGGAIIVRF